MSTKHKIFLFPISLAVIFFSSIIIIFSPAGKTNIIALPTPTIAPTPTEVPWLTYQNEKYNFEFQYPRNWEPVTENFTTSNIVGVKNLNPILLTIADKSKESSCGPYLCYSSISVYTPIKNLPKLTGRSWLEKFYLDNKLIDNKENFDKLDLVEFTITGHYSLREKNKVFIFYDNQVFVIELVIENGTDKNYLEKTFTQILSTFKYTPSFKILSKEAINKVVNLPEVITETKCLDRPGSKGIVSVNSQPGDDNPNYQIHFNKTSPNEVELLAIFLVNANTGLISVNDNNKIISYQQWRQNHQVKGCNFKPFICGDVVSINCPSGYDCFPPTSGTCINP